MLGNSSPPHSDALTVDTGHLVVDGRNFPVTARTAPTMGSGCHGLVLARARGCEKIVDFFGWSARRRKRNDTPRRRYRTCRACWEGSCKGGGVLLGWTTAYYLVKGTQGVNCIVAAGGKWLRRSIFVGKTNLGGRFRRCSGTHDPRQRATKSLRLGENHVNVA